MQGGPASLRAVGQGWDVHCGRRRPAGCQRQPSLLSGSVNEAVQEAVDTIPEESHRGSSPHRSVSPQPSEQPPSCLGSVADVAMLARLLLLCLVPAGQAASGGTAAAPPALGRSQTSRRGLQQATPAPEAACLPSQTLQWTIQSYAPLTMCRSGALQFTWTGAALPDGTKRCLHQSIGGPVPCAQPAGCSAAQPIPGAQLTCTAQVQHACTRKCGPQPWRAWGVAVPLLPAGIHTVALVPGPFCPDDWTAPGVVELAPVGSTPPSGGSYTAALNRSGTLFFTCSYSTHCMQGGPPQVARRQEGGRALARHRERVCTAACAGMAP